MVIVACVRAELQRKDAQVLDITAHVTETPLSLSQTYLQVGLRQQRHEQRQSWTANSKLYAAGIKMHWMSCQSATLTVRLMT